MLARKYPNAIVNVSIGSIPQEVQESLLRAVGEHFYRLIIVPSMDWLYCIPDRVANLGGAFALTLRRNLCDKRRLRLKRAFDLIACTCLTLLALPVLLVLALCIKLDSAGPVIFRQTRIGREGKPFRVFKFRTMQADAEAILKAYLAANPEEAREWAATQKLKHDPRITRMGRFLRRTSLDEVPQVLNVLLGEMSLVGPRPIVESEVAKYGDVFPLYAQVLPGITGLWQISGRNDISYEERVILDRYYITNWSIWFDWYILARTVPVVLGRRGAY
jgi:Undecaprenyl-phosphate galactose phosphotransferase WbaP